MSLRDELGDLGKQVLRIQRRHLLRYLCIGLGFGRVGAVLLCLGLLNRHLGLHLRLLDLLLGF